MTERLLEARVSFVVESNFYPDEQTTRVRDLLERYNARAFEVHCTATADVLQRRFNERERHPGHGDASFYTREGASDMRHRNRALALSSDVVRVDTSYGQRVDLERIISTIREAGHGQSDG